VKELKTIIVVLLIILPIYGVQRYVEAMTPVWKVTAAQQAAIDIQHRQQDAQVDAQAHAIRTQDWTDAQRMFLWVVVLGLAGVVAVGIGGHYDRRRESWARPVDGTFALQHFKHGGQVWVVDHNKGTSKKRA
jgi:hypothetical protein